MLERFLNHNLHWKSVEEFQARDPHLSQLAEVPLVASYEAMERFPLTEPGIYTLSGGRQLGKTTCLKQLMRRALENKALPKHVLYLSCDVVIDRSELYDIVKFFLESLDFQPGWLMLDEVTFIEGWDLTIKALADEGLLRHVVCCLSGSDKILLQDAIMRLPGRRGDAEQHDYELHPLLFSEVVSLIASQGSQGNGAKDLNALFDLYLTCGGYIVALNQSVAFGDIKSATYRTYQHWIIGDFIRLKRSQKNVLQVLFAIINCYGSQVSFQTLAEHTEGLSKDTVNDYCSLLERLGVISIQFALDQNKLRAAPRKHKKIQFLDPFIARALHQLVCEKYQQVRAIDESFLVESVCYNHFQRFYPSYYIKGDGGEVDIAYIDNGQFVPVEIKWRNKLRPADLKQIKKYNNAFVLARQDHDSTIDGVPVYPLVQRLNELTL